MNGLILSPPSLPPWPQAPPELPWRDRAAIRLIALQNAAVASGRAAPAPYAAQPANITRHMFGEQSGSIEQSRINEDFSNPPATTPSPQMIWPRGAALLGRS